MIRENGYRAFVHNIARGDRKFWRKSHFSQLNAVEASAHRTKAGFSTDDQVIRNIHFWLRLDRADSDTVHRYVKDVLLRWSVNTEDECNYSDKSGDRDHATTTTIISSLTTSSPGRSAEVALYAGILPFHLD